MHPNDGRVVSNFIIQTLTNKDITVYGKGSQTRSFCYVDDMIEGFIRLMNTSDDVSGPINLGNPHELSILELAEKLIEMTGSKSKIIYETLPQDDPTRRKPDITRAKQILDWQPKISLEDGLSKTIGYFEELLKTIQL
jgi:UDP-glucuronate decarboxylase